MSECIICGPSILFSTFSNFCNNLTSVYPISVSAKFCPMQMRGPPLNGMSLFN